MVGSSLYSQKIAKNRAESPCWSCSSRSSTTRNYATQPEGAKFFYFEENHTKPRRQLSSAKSCHSSKLKSTQKPRSASIWLRQWLEVWFTYWLGEYRHFRSDKRTVHVTDAEALAVSQKFRTQQIPRVSKVTYPFTKKVKNTHISVSETRGDERWKPAHIFLSLLALLC